MTLKETQEELSRVQKESKLLIEKKDKEIELLKNDLANNVNSNSQIDKLNETINYLQNRVRALERLPEINPNGVISYDQHNRIVNEKDQIIQNHLKTINNNITTISQMENDMNKFKAQSISDKQNYEKLIQEANKQINQLSNLISEKYRKNSRHSPLFVSDFSHSLINEDKIKQLNIENESMKKELLSVKGNNNPCMKHIQEINMLNQRILEKDQILKRYENEISNNKNQLEEREVLYLYLYFRKHVKNICVLLIV